MKIDIKLTSVEVKAEVRELRCVYTREMAKDINLHGGMMYNDGFIRRTLRKESINNIFNKKHDK